MGKSENKGVVNYGGKVTINGCAIGDGAKSDGKTSSITVEGGVVTIGGETYIDGKRV